MSRTKQKSSKVGLYLLVIALIVGIGVYWIINRENISNPVSSFLESNKDKVITKENYDDIIAKMEENVDSEEELYYLSYAIIYHITRDGLSSAFSGNDTQEAMYVNIYGKTIGQLIDEGKQLMQDNNMTIEKYKEQLKKTSNTISE